MFKTEWYYNLIKPAFAPPDLVFRPVWIILYITIFISLFLYIKAPYKNKSFGYILFFTQLLLNLMWTPIFFIMHNIAYALFIIVLLDIFVLLTIKSFYKINKYSGLLLIPYFIWILFATYLNMGYLILNR